MDCPSIRVFVAFGLALGGGLNCCRGVEVNARAAALASILADQTRAHVQVLADDTFEGREAGSRGNRAAGIYIVDLLKKWGLKPAGTGGTWYQAGNGSNNILALVEGRDEKLRDEVILVGGHYDHVGYGNNRNSYGPTGFIHNGADDNASGVAALLEVAEALSQLPEKPARSILIAFWDGEEKGLLGSKYWVDHPTVPLDRVKVAINADMVGRLRGNRLEVMGTRTAPGLRQIVSQQNDVPELNLDFNWDLRGDSDHYSFFSRSIPVLMVHTGMHSDYHRPSDDVEKINHDGVRQVAQLLFGVAVDLAEAPALGRFRNQSRFESQFSRRAAESTLSPPPGRLGVRWQAAAAAEGKIVVEAITPGSAAEKAGLRPGDQLVTLGQYPIDSAEQLRMRVLAATSGVRLTYLRPGEEKPREVALQLPGNPARLGISWRTDDAEPNAVIVNRLTPGSPADVAGLRLNDRIYAINGRGFNSGDEFRALANPVPENNSRDPQPLVITAETGGRVRTITVPQVADEGAEDPAAAQAASQVGPQGEVEPVNEAGADKSAPGIAD